MKKLLIETNLFEGKINEDAGGRTLVTGILQRCGNYQNQNGRVYPREILEREVNQYQKLIKERRALGELDHPDSQVINLKNVSHNIKEVWWDGDTLMGTVEILSTPSGNILKELLRAEILLGISSRGMGSVETLKDGKTQVGEDFNLIGWDFVSNPSVHDAFMSPIMESKVIKQGEICNEYCKAQDIIREILIELN
jgi:hypothetical protein